ncbi:MAG TPA: class I SAM-dependent methyltransferase [Gemmatimonadales bacterium]|nr:class I SAM-dependent methyltransferase [Gemmatimonadales bacterium]
MFSLRFLPGARALTLGLIMAPSLPATAQVSRSPDVHFVPTPHEVVAAMLKVANVRKNDVLYDLGSGDGRIVIAAARKYGTRGTGIDIDSVRVAEGRLGARKAGVTAKAKFQQADLFETDLRDATVVTLYLLPTLNVKLRPKLFSELRPGSRVVSHAFDMGSWKPDSTFMVGTSAVFYWVIPANVGGEWAVSATGGKQYTLRLTQKFQHVEGTAELNGKSVPVSTAAVHGDKVILEIADPDGPVRLTGRVRDDVITGTHRGSKWRARRNGPAPALGTEADA